MNKEDKQIHDLLSTYLKKLEKNTLTFDERMMLVNFYISNTKINVPEDDENIEQYLTLGWYIHYLLQQQQQSNS